MPTKDNKYKFYLISYLSPLLYPIYLNIQMKEKEQLEKQQTIVIIALIKII